MGRDKALLEIDGERMIDRAVDRMSVLGGQVVVASGATRSISGLEEPQVRDRVSDGGPLAGIEAGLEVAGSELVAVVGVDLPDSSPEVLRHLSEAWDGNPVGIAPVVRGRCQPLHACWVRSAKAVVTEALDAGKRSVTTLFIDAGGQLAGPEVWGELDPSASFVRNVNRPEDLRRRSAD